LFIYARSVATSKTIVYGSTELLTADQLMVQFKQLNDNKK
jgi:hypothetical protein